MIVPQGDPRIKRPGALGAAAIKVGAPNQGLMVEDPQR
jgi:hypothetical protein